MIIKKIVKKKKTPNNSFKQLAEHLLKIENRGFQFTNCIEEGIKHAIGVVHITQLINTTAKTDKTLHLVVYFPEYENPSPETMKAIEAELVKSIGFENHQRLSVVHDNTNNLHIHIAINRIDPETYHCTKEPLGDFAILQNKAIELEEKYHLKRTNHTKTTKAVLQ